MKRFFFRTVPWLVAILAAVAARLIAHFCLNDAPHVMDEIAYFFQAKTLLTGHVAAAVQEPRAAFALWFVDDRTQKVGIFPPGWPAVLAAGIGLHLREWVNPFLHFLTTLVVAACGRRLGGDKTRVLASILYGFSPQALFLAASFMSHTIVAFGAVCTLWAGIALNAGRRKRRATFVGGFGIAVALLSRPLCGVVVAVGFAALVAFAFARKRVSVVGIAVAAVPILAGVLALGGYNRAVTGSASRFPQTMWFDEHEPPMDDPFFRYRPGCNALGFGEGHGCDEGIKNATHDLPNAISNTGDNLISWLFLAGGGPLAFVFPAIAIWKSRSRAHRRFLLGVLTTVPAAIVLYALYWYAGTCFGARFYQAALPALLLLTAVGLRSAARWKSVARRWLPLAYALLTLPGLVIGLQEISDTYWGNDGRFERVRANWNHGWSVVMVAFANDGLPMHPLRVTGFTSKSPHSVWHNGVRALGALVLDSPDPQKDEIVFAKFHPALVSDLRTRFPNRTFYVYVLHDDPADDRLEAYKADRWSDDTLAAPKVNFDGYVVPKR
ncbi:MAG TPA: hypothetical protein VF407_10065 [Polyangiaceae bacterium]